MPSLAFLLLILLLGEVRVIIFVFLLGKVLLELKGREDSHQFAESTQVVAKIILGEVETGDVLVVHDAIHEELEALMGHSSVCQIDLGDNGIV